MNWGRLIRQIALGTGLAFVVAVTLYLLTRVIAFEM